MQRLSDVSPGWTRHIVTRAGNIGDFGGVSHNKPVTKPEQVTSCRRPGFNHKERTGHRERTGCLCREKARAANETGEALTASTFAQAMVDRDVADEMQILIS
jgi:hypothetical protein